MPVSRQQIIIRVFRKYSHSLGPEELEYLDEILKEHDISDEDVEMQESHEVMVARLRAQMRMADPAEYDPRQLTRLL